MKSTSSGICRLFRCYLSYPWHFMRYRKHFDKVSSSNSNYNIRLFVKLLPNEKYLQDKKLPLVFTLPSIYGEIPEIFISSMFSNRFRNVTQPRWKPEYFSDSPKCSSLWIQTIECDHQNFLQVGLQSSKLVILLRKFWISFPDRLSILFLKALNTNLLLSTKILPQKCD